MGSDGSINHAAALVWANDGHGGRAQFIIDSNEEIQSHIADQLGWVTTTTGDYTLEDGLNSQLKLWVD